jgi:hypothetical protein
MTETFCENQSVGSKDYERAQMVFHTIQANKALYSDASYIYLQI